MDIKKVLIIGSLILATSALIIGGTITARNKITKMKENITKEVTANVKKDVMEEVKEKIKAEVIAYLQKTNQEAPCTKNNTGENKHTKCINILLKLIE